ncbi:phosphoadenosine phosphosulfate reductase family protein [Brevibacillus agri]|uniref:phosphoadenosine phosphosulfate reductase domain-containing protein n=1 Tax=Brevibacillus agri TaxID=51101 RepID=UPI003D19451B
MKHVVMYSGGIGSWAAAKRVAQEYGTDDLILLFTDTKCEDEDLYRFLEEGAKNIGGQLVWLEEGRDIWEVFKAVKYLGNTRVDPCSRILKRELSRKWIEENFQPDEAILYVGIDYTEYHRYSKNQMFWQPYTVKAPMCEQPYMDKRDMMRWLGQEGIKAPRLYELGFSHNNCGGFCVKAGQAQFYTLLKTMPERYAYHEQKEQELFEYLGKKVPFLRQTRNGKTVYVSLKDFREQIAEAEQNQRDIGEQIDMFDFGGCGCFSDFEEVACVI